MDLRPALKAAGYAGLLGAALVVLSRFQPEPSADAPRPQDWPRYGPCPHPGCGRPVEELIRHPGLTDAYRTLCGHLVQEIPAEQRVDGVWQLRLYRKRRR